MRSSLLAFAAFAAVLTVTPGLDTVLVLRTTVARGRLAGFAAALGIALGCLCWAVASALGITALLAASRLGYELLRWAGVAYLCWLGIRTLWRSRAASGVAAQPGAADGSGAAGEPGAAAPSRAWTALRTGLFTNLLNPKVGVFYLSVLPQFLPHGVPPLLGATALGTVHIVEGLVWLGLVILAVGRAGRLLSRPPVRRRLDQLTGVVFVAFGLRLAAEGGHRTLP